MINLAWFCQRSIALLRPWVIQIEFLDNWMPVAKLMERFDDPSLFEVTPINFIERHAIPKYLVAGRGFFGAIRQQFLYELRMERQVKLLPVLRRAGA